ncbi:hypothetical protein GW7_04774 [Heterocephalus glaber]|uniref:Uncharacterized protein n=1 Tax=Heterocephalus glaber TaxID=10181 RepID=G5C3E4_HETGA|nr:hypothetical protein GW7_04774 [Heterocephalus glaber]
MSACNGQWRLLLVEEAGEELGESGAGAWAWDKGEAPSRQRLCLPSPRSPSCTTRRCSGWHSDGDGGEEDAGASTDYACIAEKKPT